MLTKQRLCRREADWGNLHRSTCDLRGVPRCDGLCAPGRVPRCSRDGLTTFIDRPAYCEETLSTLRYADQAKKIKNKAVVNEDPNAKLVRELKEELQTLRARVSGSSGEDKWDPKVPPEKQIVTYQAKDGTIKKVSKAELQGQLETSEKLMNDLNETWEQKIVRTQEVQKEREKALEEFGITVEKNNGNLPSGHPRLKECVHHADRVSVSAIARRGAGASDMMRGSVSRWLKLRGLFSSGVFAV
ncbi:hypothetical protein JB92DRAFT_1855913 [Gautieria morchelliformis]|nr:hypothetical protein JB92DRAFT_1855913 [Gautieria morchelliformis]